MAQYQLSTLIKEFADAQKNLSNFSPNQKDAALKEAIGLAHADMSRHAKGHIPAIKDESVNWLFDYFKASNTNPFSVSNFDAWHEKACNDYCLHMNQNTGFKMTVGRAQKVINMTFKYLYCTAAYRGNVENIVDKLHMALDKYTLKWYKDNLVKYGQKGAVPEWSKIDDYQDYKNIKKAIFDYFPKKPPAYQDANGKSLPPFLAEFIIWKKERILEDLGVFNKILNDLPNNKWAIEQSTINSLKQDLLNIEKQL